MGQRVRMRKNQKTVKGVAIRKSGGSNPNNTVTVGRITLRGGGKIGGNRRKKKVAVRRKRK